MQISQLGASGYIDVNSVVPMWPYIYGGESFLFVYLFVCSFVCLSSSPLASVLNSSCSSWGLRDFH